MQHSRAAPGEGTRAARAPLLLGAMVANVAAAGCFLLLPWAEGRGLLAGRSFAGPAFARLLRNTDVVLGGWSGGVVAALLVAGLFAAPVIAMMAATLAGSAPLAHHPRRAAGAAVALSLAAAAVAAVLAMAVWLSGRLAEAPLAGSPAVPGSLGAAAASAVAAALARAARR